ncbi:GIY-YIG nuclease family protein [Winogradskyella tangerina]|uniref:GIY-YIG nuclease family protein n=1 Tax=Winogradskyella tangerina TaxID=2023240 RepID=UPI000DBE372B|nr:GIY-YIG nuclease family protein [Winogradskyella tangerina]
MPYFVYILYSKKFDTFYKGQTKDLFERIRRHNSGLEKSTKRYTPWELLWYSEKSSRSEAMTLERKLKNLSKERLKKFIKKYS